MCIVLGCSKTSLSIKHFIWQIASLLNWNERRQKQTEIERELLDILHMPFNLVFQTVRNNSENIMSQSFHVVVCLLDDMCFLLIYWLFTLFVKVLCEYVQ